MQSEGSHRDYRSSRREYDDSDSKYDRRSKRTLHDDDSRERSGRSGRSRDRDREPRSRSPRSTRNRSRERYGEKARRRGSSKGRSQRQDPDREENSDASHNGGRSRRSPDAEISRASKSKRDRGDVSEGRHEAVKRGGPLPSQADSFALVKSGEAAPADKPVEKPNFGNTGLLAAASNSITQADGNTVTLKYHEPPEARKPSPRDQWKLFVFKGADIVDNIDIGHRSCWLVGRDVAVVDLPAEHPSISKQHAVIQFRYTEKRNEFGDKIGKVKPYLIDLESANGTQLNNEKVPDSRYLELRHKDMVQFGLSTREYVIMLAPKD